MYQIFKETLQFRVFVDQCNIFMHHGATCHKSKVVENFFGEKNIRLLDWSGNWPDLNPIQNLLMLLKKCRENSQQAKNYSVTALK